MPTSDLDLLLEPALRQALIHAIREQGHATIGQLANQSDATLARIVSSITIQELLTGDASTSRRRSPGNPTKSKRGENGKPTAAAGNYEVNVIKMLTDAGAPLRSEQIRSKLGGSAAKLRVVMEKLMTSGKVKRRGVRRGTNYALK